MQHLRAIVPDLGVQEKGC